MDKSTVNPLEVAKFSSLTQGWWDRNGALKTLHDINPLRLDFIKNQLNLTGIRILDLGCGGGLLTEALSKEGALMTGLDVNEELIAMARIHAEEQGLKIHYVVQPVETFQAEPFDAIVCMEMLEHVDDFTRIIAECKRLLKPEGRLFLSTLNRTVQAYMKAIVGAEYLLNLLPRQTHDYQKFIKPSELAACLRRNGFTVSKIQGMDYNPFSRQASLTQDVSVNYLLTASLG